MLKLIENWIERRKLNKWNKDKMEERLCEAKEKQEDVKLHLSILESERGAHSDEFKARQKDLGFANLAYSMILQEADKKFGQVFVDEHFFNKYK